jgi:2-polyprenyl-6-methoxyphenol hydroxylase-like FAD-dependent oxidoreductase
MENVPVLIVGAGPAGLAAAITLSRYGIESLLVERRADMSSLPRSTVISTRSMEILRSWGLTERATAGAVDVRWRQWISSTMASPDGHEKPVGLPTPAEAAPFSPESPACVAQDHLEPVLMAHVRELGVARVVMEATATVVSTRDDGFVVQVGTRLVHTRYLIAADGARSTIRDALGIAMDGPAEVGGGTSVLIRSPLWDVVGPRRHVIYAVEEGIFLPAGPGDRWIFGAYGPLPDDIVALIRRAAGVDDLPVAIERTRVFTFGAQIASRWRGGNAFLTGDAAHRVGPRGGTGMNNALHDGHDLGWKLAWVLRGWAADDLLDSYEEDRRPPAAHNLARTLDPDGTNRPVAGELAVDLGRRLPHVWLPDGRSTLDLVGPGYTVLTTPDGPVADADELVPAMPAARSATPGPTPAARSATPGPIPAARPVMPGPAHTAPPATPGPIPAARSATNVGPVPVAVRRLDPATIEALGGPLVVRPDGVPAGQLVPL